MRACGVTDHFHDLTHRDLGGVMAQNIQISLLKPRAISLASEYSSHNNALWDFMFLSCHWKILQIQTDALC